MHCVNRTQVPQLRSSTPINLIWTSQGRRPRAGSATDHVRPLRTFCKTANFRTWLRGGLKSSHVDSKRNTFRVGGRGFGPIRMRSTKKKSKEDAHLDTAEKIDVLRKLTAQGKISAHELCRHVSSLLIHPCAWSTLSMDKESGWPPSQKRCSIQTSHRAFSIWQKWIPRETRCFRRFHDQGWSQGNFENGWQKAECGTLHNADMYVYDHTSSGVGREGAFAKMKVVAFRINMRTIEVTPNCCKVNEQSKVTKISLYERHFHTFLIDGRSQFSKNSIDQAGKNDFTKINHTRTVVILRHSHALLNGTTSSGYVLFSVSNSFWCSPAA